MSTATSCRSVLHLVHFAHVLNCEQPRHVRHPLPNTPSLQSFLVHFEMFLRRQDDPRNCDKGFLNRAFKIAHQREDQECDVRRREPGLYEFSRCVFPSLQSSKSSDCCFEVKVPDSSDPKAQLKLEELPADVEWAPRNIYSRSAEG